MIFSSPEPKALSELLWSKVDQPVRCPSSVFGVNFFLLTRYRPQFLTDCHQTWSKCLSWWCLDPFRNWVILGQKLGH